MVMRGKGGFMMSVICYDYLWMIGGVSVVRVQRKDSRYVCLRHEVTRRDLIPSIYPSYSYLAMKAILLHSS